MKAKFVILLAMVVSVYGAYRHFTAGPSPARALARSGGSTAPYYGRPDVACIQPEGDIAPWREPGRITVFAFVSEKCSACTRLKQRLSTHLRYRPDTAVRFIDLGKKWKTVDGRARWGQYIRTIPHVVVYGADGKLLAADHGRDKGGLDALWEWMNYESQRVRTPQ